jgi:endonuclease YncB( thermonuclease family)
MAFPLFHFKAVALRVVDGDTAWLRIDRGFREYFETSCRLFGLNAPELSTGAPGAASRDWLTQRITGKTLYIVSAKLDKYGRPLVTLYDPEPLNVDYKTSINQQMLDLGLAVAYTE